MLQATDLTAPLIYAHTLPEKATDVTALLKDGVLDEQSALNYLLPHKGHFVEVRHEREGKLISLRMTGNIRPNLGGKNQALAMFGGPVTGAAAIGYQGTAQTAQWTATGLKDNGTTPGGWAANQWANYLLHATGATVPVYGVVTANQVGGTLNGSYTVDRWYNYGTPGGAAGTTPSGAVTFAIEGIAPWQFMALSTDAGSVVSDYAWTGEIVAGTDANLVKVQYSQAYTFPSASGNASTQTFQMIGSHTFTASATVNSIQKCALSNSLVASTGLYGLIAAFSSVNVISGDTLTPSYTVVG